ncbi:MAG: L-threonylcarbamoyladenylate synthase [Saprospiraceae bacterium]|nr:L-threonylcarbamoyladenylate synthase [Saprospiraceae bacterium]
MKKINTKIGLDVALAAQWLRASEPVAIPTETVYGLAGNALDVAAVARIFEVKNRPTFDPLIVHVANVAAVEAHVLDFPIAARQMAAHFWPGPLTLLLPKQAHIPDLVTAGLPRVAIRVPVHPLTRALLESLPFPLAAPSANPFGYISPTTAQHVYDQLNGLIPYILDGGACEVGVESTIVGWEGEEAVLYRLGGISVEAIESVIGKIRVQPNQSSNPAAPGMLKSHYAPAKPLYLGDLSVLSKQFATQKTGVLSLEKQVDLPAHFLEIVLSETGDLSEAAQHLFAALRQLDTSDIDIIIAAPMPELGLGRAINDRLRRASVQTNPL